MPYNALVYTFIKARVFTRLVLKYLSDDEYQKLQMLLIEDPSAGEVIRETGGVRKLRWIAAGRGKRGGYRVIYYPKTSEGIIWMLTMYAKNVADAIPKEVLRKISIEVENE